MRQFAGVAVKESEVNAMKNCTKIGWVVLFSVLLAGLGCLGRKEERAGREEEKVEPVDSKDLPNTIITSHLEEKVIPGKNLIYCSTFQLAWNELRDEIIKEDIRLTDEPSMVKVLNKKMTTKADISEDCYVATAGFGGDGILERINEALRLKFKHEAPTVEVQLRPDSILAYAFLLKDLKFATPFESLKAPIRFRSASRTVRVRAFGIREYRPRQQRHAKMGRQVSILAYEYRTDECVVSLASKSPRDEIILARVKPGGTLLETIRSAQKMIEDGRPDSLHSHDTLQIPKLDFDVRHSYAELINKFLLNKGFTSYWIARARQDIRFRLNEKGAMLKSKAEIEVESAQERWLIFDSPFLVYLREKQGEYPYLAIWVDNPEILLKQ